MHYVNVLSMHKFSPANEKEKRGHCHPQCNLTGKRSGSIITLLICQTTSLQGQLGVFIFDFTEHIARHTASLSTFSSSLH